MKKHKLKNWRPISLLNTDYKVITKILATRLKEILPSIISMAQTCGISGRNIQDNIFTIANLIEKTEDDDEGFLLTALDQEKAFDRISHKYMIETLRKFNFHPNFIQWISTLYTGITSRVKVNENLTNAIEIRRGVRQGCPLSMPLFVVCMEPLIQAITKSNYLKGVTLTPNNPIKILVYADDTLLILNNVKEYNSAMTICRQFSKAYNSKINDEKTNILKVGKLRMKIIDHQQIANYLTEKIKILGVWYGKHREKAKLNYGAILGKCEKLTNFYKGKVQTLEGKKIIITTFILPQLWHTAATVYPESKHPKELDKLIRNFIWYPRKNNPINLKTLHLPENKGGIDLMDYRKRLKNLQIFKLHVLLDDKKQALWKDWAMRNLYLHLRNIAPAYTEPHQPFKLFPSNIYRKIIELNKTEMKEEGKITQIYKKVRQIEQDNLSIEETPPNIEIKKKPNYHGRKYGNIIVKPKDGHLERGGSCICSCTKEYIQTLPYQETTQRGTQQEGNAFYVIGTGRHITI